MISKTAEYALRAAFWLARSPGRAISAEAMAKVTKVPRRYLHKVLQDLIRSGLVHSQPGPGGGYSLKSSPEEVTVLDIINAVSPLERITACPLGLPSHIRLCPLHKELDQVYAITQKALSGVTLGQLTRSSSKIIPLCDVGIHKAGVEEQAAR